MVSNVCYFCSQTNVLSAVGDVVDTDSRGQVKHISAVSAVDVATTNHSAGTQHRVHAHSGQQTIELSSHRKKPDKFVMGKPHLRTTGCRLPYMITLCYYLPPDTSEHTPR